MYKPVVTCCVVSVGLLLANQSQAHEGHDHDTPSGLWPDHLASHVMLVDPDASDRYDIQPIIQLDRRITSWMKSDGTTGSSPDTAIHTVVGTVLADVNTIAYDTDYAYIRTSGIPSHAVGPFNGNPSVPGDLDATYRITLNPTEQTGTHTSAAYSLGNIGVMLNGVGIYGPWDSTFWRSQTNALSQPGDQQPPNGSQWNVNALWRRADGMDDARGHPSPINNQTNPDGSTKGRYHYHMLPESLVEQLDPGNDGSAGSPIIGFAYDGYAIVGPFAYQDQGDGTLVAIQMTSSYGLIDERTSLGTTPGGNPSPVPTQGDYELGSFIEDFEYKPSSGTLNAFNMAFVRFDSEGRAVLVDETDSDGQWAYFLTVDVIDAISGNDTDLDGEVAWPYIIGPEFFGIFDDPGNQIVVPNDITYYFEYGTTTLAGDTDSDGDIDDSDLGTSFANYTGPVGDVGKTAAEGDTDGDGDVDDSDLGTAFAGYTGPLTPLTVPEPSQLAVIFAGLALALARRHTRGNG